MKNYVIYAISIFALTFLILFSPEIAKADLCSDNGAVDSCTGQTNGTPCKIFSASGTYTCANTANFCCDNTSGVCNRLYGCNNGSCVPGDGPEAEHATCLDSDSNECGCTAASCNTMPCPKTQSECSCTDVGNYCSGTTYTQTGTDCTSRTCTGTKDCSTPTPDPPGCTTGTWYCDLGHPCNNGANNQLARENSCCSGVGIPGCSGGYETKCDTSQCTISQGSISGPIQGYVPDVTGCSTAESRSEDKRCYENGINVRCSSNCTNTGAYLCKYGFYCNKGPWNCCIGSCQEGSVKCGYGSCSSSSGCGWGTKTDDACSSCGGDNNAGSSTIACWVGDCTYSVSGYVWIDSNADGSKGAGESNYTGSFSINSISFTAGSGTYSISGVSNGSYTATFTVPSGYSATTVASRTVTISDANYPNVNFGIVPKRTLTVSTAGTGATNSVSSNPAGISACDRDSTTASTCSASFNHGTQVNLTGSYDSVRTNLSWSSNCTVDVSTNRCRVTMDADKSVTATFSLSDTEPPTITKPQLGLAYSMNNNCFDKSNGINQWAGKQPVRAYATDIMGVASVRFIVRNPENNAVINTFNAGLSPNTATETNTVFAGYWEKRICFNPAYPSGSCSADDLAEGRYSIEAVARDTAGNQRTSTPLVNFRLDDPCVDPWIQTTGGDVHSNTGINTPGGP